MDEKTERLLTLKEYHHERQKLLDQQSKGEKICSEHDWVNIKSPESVRVKRVGEFGEKIVNDSLFGLWRCINCGKTVISNPYYSSKEYFEELHSLDPCFIATAAYGTPIAPQLDVLRHFRDVYLPASITELYYRLSPPLASVIAKRQRLRQATRVWLDPLVKAVRKLMESKQ